MQNSQILRGQYPGPPGTILRTPVSGEMKVCFRSPKMYKNSPTAMQNSKIFPGTIPRTFVLSAGKFVFVLQKFTKTLLFSSAEFPNSPGTLPRTPVLEERKVCFRSPKMYQNSPTAMQNSKKKSGGISFLGTGGKSCLLLKLSGYSSVSDDSWATSTYTFNGTNNFQRSIFI